MSTARVKSVKTKTRKKIAKKVDSVLSICPVDGAGWCPYPFSAAQLKKRLKRLQEESDSQSKNNAPVPVAVR